MFDLRVVFLTLKVITLLEYRQNKVKYSQFIPFYNFFIYNIVTVSPYFILLLVLGLTSNLIIMGYFKIEYIFMILSFFLCFLSFMSEAYIELFEQKYNFIKYINCGIFNLKEKSINNRGLAILMIGKNSIIYILSIFYFNFLNIYIIKENIIFHLFVSFGSLFIYCLSLIIGYRSWLNNNILKRKNSNMNLSIFIGLICIFLSKIFKINILKIDFNNIRIIFEQPIFIFLFYLFIVVYIIISNNFVIKSPIKFKKIIFKNIIKEFYEREVKNKLTVFVWILFSVNLFQGSEIGKNLLIIIIVSFMFSIYNNRFMLCIDFLNYYYLIANKNFFISICKHTFFFPFSITIISTIFLNYWNIKNILLYGLFNVLLLFFNIAIGTAIYSLGFKTINEDKKKLSNIEIMSGIFYIFELIIVLNILLK